MIKTFCISLPNRRDRREKVLANCFRVGLKPIWINAVDGRDNQIGSVNACKYSHWFCIKLAQHEHLDKFLVLEDDVEFSEDFSLDLKDVPPDWDMIYFGGNHVNSEPVHVKNNVYKCGKTLCAHAIIIRHTCYDLLLQKLLEGDEPVDVLFAQLHEKDVNAYVIYPHTAWQFGSFSDIEKRDVWYGYVKDWDMKLCNK